MHKKILGIFLAAVLLLPCAASAKESDTCPYRITVNQIGRASCRERV